MTSKAPKCRNRFACRVVAIPKVSHKRGSRKFTRIALVEVRSTSTWLYNVLPTDSPYLNKSTLAPGHSGIRLLPHASRVRFLAAPEESLCSCQERPDRFPLSMLPLSPASPGQRPASLYATAFEITAVGAAGTEA